MMNRDINLSVEIVPNIDQYNSNYNAAIFEAILTPPVTADFRFIVDVIGRFSFSLDGRVLLTGRSQSGQPQLFNTTWVHLSRDEYYTLTLQYAFDISADMLAATPTASRRVRLLWESSAIAQAVVPPTSLYHSFEMLHGFPKVITPVNDPAPCASNRITELRNLDVGDTGAFQHGTPGRMYNSDSNCKWLLHGAGLVRFNLFIDYLDIEYTPGCSADSLQLQVGAGATNEIVGPFCGVLPRGFLLTSRRANEVTVTFSSDDAVERLGFNITYSIDREDSPPPTS